MRTKDGKTSARVRNSNLTDELGQVGIFFCDKTGTLTQNKMVFSRCCVLDKMYCVETTKKNLNNEELLRLLEEKDKASDGFLSLLSVCHTALPDYPDCKEEHDHSINCDSKLVFQAESPDEQALLLMAKNHHYIYTNRSYASEAIRNSIWNVEILEVEIFGKKNLFKIYQCFEFTSERKKMSVIAEDERDGKIRLYTKGADSEVFKSITRESREKSIECTNNHINNFSAKGLRSLACASKEIPRKEFEEWMVKFIEAKKQVPVDENRINELIASIESGLTLLGATGVEDKLQDKVPETLKMISEAGISVWILTGDKTQTALNIVKSCKILSEPMYYYPNLVVLEITEEVSEEEAKEKTKRFLERTWNYVKNKEHNSWDQALVINGRALETIFPNTKKTTDKEKNKPKKNNIKNKKDKKAEFEAIAEMTEEEPELDRQKLLMDILLKCRVVVCCRVSPYQKSQVVDLYKKRKKNTVTLAIGDGANDVPMLKTADVGVGITGREGMQASRSADFSVNQFKDVKSLTLFHGAMNYARICKLINFSFYKNIALVTVIYCFVFYNGYSNSIIIPQDSLMFHNIIFTHVPIFCVSLFDQPYTRKSAYKFPFLFRRGIRNELLNAKVWFQYLFKAMIHGLLVLLLHKFLLNETFVGRDGSGLPECVLSISLFNSTLAVVTAEAIFASDRINFMNIMSLLYTIPCSILFGFGFNYVEAIVVENTMCIEVTYREPYVWIILFYSVVICCLPRLVVQFFVRLNCPSNVNLVNELETIKCYKNIKRKEPTEEEFVVKGRKDSTLGYSEYYPPERKGAAKWIELMRSKLSKKKIAVS